MKYRICFEGYDGKTRGGKALFSKEEADEIVADLNRRHPTIKHWAEPERVEKHPFKHGHPFSWKKPL